MGWGSCWRSLGKWGPLGGEGWGLRTVLGTHGWGGEGAEGSGCPKGRRHSLFRSPPWRRPGTPGAARRRSAARPRRTRIPWTPGSRGPAAWSSTGGCRSAWRSGRTGGSARSRSEPSAPAWPGGSSGRAGPARHGPRTDTARAAPRPRGQLRPSPPSWFYFYPNCLEIPRGIVGKLKLESVIPQLHLCRWDNCRSGGVAGLEDAASSCATAGSGWTSGGIP